MKAITAAAVMMMFAGAASAQTLDDLKNDGKNPDNVLTYGMGYSLNREFRHKDYATNVLTFDYVQEPEIEADLVLCAPVVEREAKQQKLALVAHYAHLLVHGTLHAQGYDHEDDGPEAACMEARETEVLAGLGFDDPYA